MELFVPVWQSHVKKFVTMHWKAILCLPPQTLVKDKRNSNSSVFIRSLSISRFFHIVFSFDMLEWKRYVDSISLLQGNNH